MKATVQQIMKGEREEAPKSVVTHLSGLLHLVLCSTSLRLPPHVEQASVLYPHG